MGVLAMSMNHVSLDLETWGKRAGCAIRSIGAVAFDPNSDLIGATFYQNVTLESCQKMKLYVDPETAIWWAQQGEKARAILEEDQVHLKAAVLNFNAWFRCLDPDAINSIRIWSHGAAFDLPIYEAAAHAVGFKAPWHYRAPRDTRTLFDLVGLSTEDLLFVGTKHNALDDAVHQAKCVQGAHRRMSDL